MFCDIDDLKLPRSDDDRDDNQSQHWNSKTPSEEDDDPSLRQMVNNFDIEQDIYNIFEQHPTIDRSCKLNDLKTQNLSAATAVVF